VTARHWAYPGRGGPQTENCACSRDRSGGYQGIENVPVRIVVVARHCALVFNRKPIPTAVHLTIIV